MSILRAHASRIVAIILVITFYAASRLPTVSPEQQADLASRFAFTTFDLPAVTTSDRSVRPVHPVYDHISAWISSVGAAAALADLDGDGLPNDVCFVDVRSDEVVLAPAPTTKARFTPFALDHGSLRHDAKTMAPMGCIPGDYNEDGLVDVLVYYWGRPPVAFLRTAGDATVARDRFVPCEVWPEFEIWNTNALTVADVDGDGHLDLVVGNYFADGARVLDAEAPDTQKEWMQHSMSRAFNAGTNRVLRWVAADAGERPWVEFVDVPGAFDEKVAHGWTLAVGACDLDGDQRPELYFGNDFGPDRLLHNRSTPGQIEFVLAEGRKGFSTPSSNVLGRDSFKGMGVDFGDVNGDGYWDVYVSNIADDFALHESHFLWVHTGEARAWAEGRAPYEQRSEARGLSRSDWGWDSKLADFDNDGVPEAVQATGFVRGDVNRWAELQELAMGNDELLAKPWAWPRFQPGDDLSGRAVNPFFVQSKSGRYVDLADRLGLARPQVSRAVAIADVDADGDQDFVVGNQWDTSRFVRNDSPSSPSLILDVAFPLKPYASLVTRDGPRSDRARAAVGAQGVVVLADGRRVLSRVDGGDGHSGVRAPQMHFGLNGESGPVTVELQWRDPTGHVGSAKIELAPGWHSVDLPWVDSRRAGL